MNDFIAATVAENRLDFIALVPGDHADIGARIGRQPAPDLAAGAVNPAGVLTVDDGAVRALRQGKSLLPAGVVAVEGSFERGDCLIVRSHAGNEIGRGLSAYASADIRLVAGHKSDEIEAILGYRGRDEIIHRDDLVVTDRR